MEGYSIGQVSKILQMPSETLRFLERKGLVAPRRNEANGYRYYAGEDIQRLIDYRWYRDAGYSVADTIAAITDTDLFQMASAMEQAESKARAEARRQGLLAERLGQYRQKLSFENLSSTLNECRLDTSPEMLFCISALEGESNQSFKYASQLAGWFDIALEYYSFLDFVMLVYYDGIMDPRMDFGTVMGYAMETSWAEALGITPPSDTVVIPPAQCVTTIVRVTLGDSLESAVRVCVEPFLHAEHLVLAGDVWANRYAILNEQGVDSGYYKVWVPVE